jgi:CheY-like chemotaxis protein
VQLKVRRDKPLTVFIQERRQPFQMIRAATSAIDATPAINVLLVDDDEQQLKMRAMIMQVYGYTPYVAACASEALAIAERKRLDIAVVDYHMPLMNGCTLASYLKAGDPQLKVILLTAALSVPSNEMRSIDKLVSKASAVPELLGAIEGLLRVAGLS